MTRRLSARIGLLGMIRCLQPGVLTPERCRIRKISRYDSRKKHWSNSRTYSKKTSNLKCR